MTPPVATIDGRAVRVSEAIACGARLLGQARRVLVTGLADAPLEAIAVACDVAEALGAAIDAGSDDSASPAGPLVARAGGITADRGELERAELAIAWFWQADEAPRAPPACRRLAVGPEPLAGWEHVPLAANAAVDAADLVHALLLDPAGRLPECDPALVGACRQIAESIAASGCIGFVTNAAIDRLGLGRWSLTRLVRFLAHGRAAFVVAVEPTTAGGLANAPGAAAFLSWRYGAAGAIARADRRGGRFLPAECDAERLLARAEVDAVLAVGRLPATIEAAIAGRAADLAVVRFDCRADEPPGAAGRCVHLWCGPAGGTLLGTDGREIAIEGPAPAADSLQARLTELLSILREQLP